MPEMYVFAVMFGFVRNAVRVATCMTTFMRERSAWRGRPWAFTELPQHFLRGYRSRFARRHRRKLMVAVERDDLCPSCSLHPLLNMQRGQLGLGDLCRVHSRRLLFGGALMPVAMLCTFVNPALARALTVVWRRLVRVVGRDIMCRYGASVGANVRHDGMASATT